MSTSSTWILRKDKRRWTRSLPSWELLRRKPLVGEYGWRKGKSRSLPRDRTGMHMVASPRQDTRGAQIRNNATATGKLPGSMASSKRRKGSTRTAKTHWNRGKGYPGTDTPRHPSAADSARHLVPQRHTRAH